MQKILQMKDIPTDKKIFAVHGNSAKNLDIGKYILSLNTVSFQDFEPNPRIESVENGVKQFTESNADIIVAIGGGSAIDTAKAIKLFTKSTAEFIAIPTTAGSGSESTKFSVICKGDEKISYADDFMIPTAVLFDPSVLSSLPTQQKKISLIDAFSHSIESYWSVNSTDESKKICRKSIDLILKYVDDYLQNQRLDEIMQASNLAGQAINLTKTTAGHAMSYVLTMKYNVPHGYAVAMCNNVLWNLMKDLPQFKDMSDFMQEFQTLLKKWNVTLGKKLSADELEFMSNSVNQERLTNHPIELTHETIKKLYGEIV